MKIQLSFDDNILRTYYGRGSPLFFHITWEHEGVFYPDPGWRDFGIEILGWWFSAVANLLEGAKEDKLQFMDGPYAIRLKYYPNTTAVDLVPEGLDVVWTTGISELAEELIRAANTISAELARLGIAEKQRTALQKAVVRFRDLLLRTLS